MCNGNDQANSQKLMFAPHAKRIGVGSWEGAVEIPRRYRDADEHCFGNRETVLLSRCGCFGCGASFAPSEIWEWLEGEDTALCPKCQLDAVIGDASVIEISPQFLNEMNEIWFGDWWPQTF